jgi:NDP-sugar pyrophosphorylase family protein
MSLRFSFESELLGTGGGIRRMADFLRESDPCLILGGDMILDADLSQLLDGHRTRGDAITLLLRNDPRIATFGSIGVDGDGRLRRIGTRFDLGGETAAGVYTWVNAVAARAFDHLPERDVFGHLDDWIAPRLAAGARDIRALLLPPEACIWEPVGTPAEYLAVNLRPPTLACFDPDVRARRDGTRFEPDLVIGAGAAIAPGASLTRAVIWDEERVDAGVHASDGVFAGGVFHACSSPGAGPAPRGGAE